MARKLATLLVAVAFMAHKSVNAQEERRTETDEIIVTASLTALPFYQVGSAVDVLNYDDLARRRPLFISDMLRDLPGVSVSRNGPIGGQTQVRLRGAEANHTLVLIDGIETGDPFNNSEFDFSNLLGVNIERVEVLRGPQSVLHGSESIGGVISIQTRRGVDAAFLSGSLEVGSFGTSLATAGLSGGNVAVSYNASAARLNSRGISVSPEGVEPDGYENLSLHLTSKLNVSEQLEFTFVGRYVEASSHQDTQDFDFLSPTQGLVVDSDSQRNTKRIYGRVHSSVSLFQGKWRHLASISITDSSNDTIEDKNLQFGNSGQKIDLEYESTVVIESTARNLTHSLTGLAEYEYQDFENLPVSGDSAAHRQTTDFWGYAAEYRINIARQLFVSAALRFDRNDLFQDKATYRITAAWQGHGSGTKLRGSYGTGVAAPSFFEMFGFDPSTFVGNPDLSPEISKGWDIGIDQLFREVSLTMSMTYFETDLQDEIYTDFSVFPFTARNRLGISPRKGYEFSARYKPENRLTITASYTQTNAKEANGLQEVRRPKHIGSFDVSYHWKKARTRVSAGLDYNGKMDDVELFFRTPEDRSKLDGFLLANFVLSFDLNEEAEIFGRIENLFDEKYQEVLGFNAPGIAAYAGLRIRFGG